MVGEGGTMGGGEEEGEVEEMEGEGVEGTEGEEEEVMGGGGEAVEEGIPQTAGEQLKQA